MKLNEIYEKLSTHMIQGMMVHEQLANYYDFLGLQGYKACHEYHFLQETLGYRKLCKYFISHHNMLIPNSPVEDPKIIPNNWYAHTRQEVDINTRKTSVKTGLTKWVSWERETKALYQQMYKELVDIGEIASALEVQNFIKDVAGELEQAEQYHLNKEAVGYDMTVILEEQKDKRDKYKQKCRELLQ